MPFRAAFVSREKEESDAGPAFQVLIQDGAPPLEDYLDEVGAVLDFISALTCANIRIEAKPARKPPKRSKPALPFDSYHYLTVDVPGKASSQGAGIGDRRSPREHIRRGHIRRLADGRALWINATMVNAGIGSRVDKGYVVRARG